MEFLNKTILITGASSGIGAALAARLAGSASALVLVARRVPELEALRAKLITAHPALQVHIHSADLTDAAAQTDLKSTLDAQGIAVDILINNAGVGDECPFHQSNAQRLDAIVDLNVKSVVSFTHLFAPEMAARPAGKGIVFIGSGGGIAPMAGSAVYSASKHFITAMALAMRAELAPLGLEVALVCPGPVDTEFDARAGIAGGMKGGPTQATRISAEECASDVVTGLEKGRAIVFPGRKLRRLMTLYGWLPLPVRVRMLMGDGKKLFRSQQSKAA